MSKRSTQFLLEDILEACQKILSYTSGMSFEEFTTNNLIIDAVARNFEIIGEATGRLPEDFRSAHPEIEWQFIIALRNRIIHEYFGINYEIIWNIREENIPVLINFIKQAIEELKE